ncbi:MAG TPA: cytochrome c-type biogenesis CcmF C-terminal domain-containing protein, partial [Solirubrobacteraceae bacterium]|nr:cytochrome c-type biogenesis CcmF C-terminal domain-containing protein [Solirubrobacteraceae bacterium]
YIVHIGIAALFVGVAGSSSFQHVDQVGLSPGQSTRVGAYTVKYVRPTASVSAANDTVHTGSTANFGAVLRVTREGRYVTTLRPSEGFYESDEIAEGSVGRLIGGQPVSHVSIQASLTRDLWSAIAPELEAPWLKRIVQIGNKTIPMSRPDEGMIAIAVLAREYLKHPPPAQFRLEVSPLIMWIWLGGLIVFGGGLLALLPAPAVLRRGARVAVRQGASALGGRPATGTTAIAGEAALELADLRAAREVKYRELRELELDYGTGKLSREDYELTGASLRGEALAILDRIEALEGGEAQADGGETTVVEPEVPAGV